MAEQTKKLPACAGCNPGRNWIDLGIIDKETGAHLFQCGGGRAYSDPNDIKKGCGRLIRATLEDMDKATVI